MFPWSVMPRAGCPSAAAAATSSPTRAAPSSMENSVWVCRCVNDRSDTGPPFATNLHGCDSLPGCRHYPGGRGPDDDRSDDLVVQGLALFVPQREEHVEDPDQPEEEEDEVDQPEHPLHQRPSERTAVAQFALVLGPHGPHPSCHHADRLAPAAADEHRAVGDPQGPCDQEGDGREAPPLGPLP